MKRFASYSHFALLALLGLMAVWLVGCATNDENMAERPWNSPKGWEGGVPGNLYDRERH